MNNSNILIQQHRGAKKKKEMNKKNPEIMKKPHAIMFTIPYQGHLNPFMHLALKLACKGFRVTFINTEHAHYSLTKSISNDNSNIHDIFAEARNSAAGLDIHYRTISDGFPLDYDRVENVLELWKSLITDFPNVLEEFIGKIISEQESSFYSPVLVSDTFPGWAPKIADKYNLLNVSFWTEPALAFATYYYKDLLIKNGHFPLKDVTDDNVDYIPGVESISTKDLPSQFKDEASETSKVLQKSVFSAFDEVRKADFILHNTVRELEPHVLSSLCSLQLPTYSIGPTNFYKESNETRVLKSLFTETDCSKWLDTKPPRSVLYISFGSIVGTDRRVIEEIARGLALSGVYFLWTIRSYTSNGSPNCDGVVLPEGFLEEMADKGFIVPWCDQRAVLSHRAVGGFLTHCGWNSVLESMWFGVPMICYPVTYDQPTNRKLVVDDWKIGVNLYDDKEMVSAKHVAEKINKVMNHVGGGGDRESEIRQEVDKVTKIMHDALDGNGSSEANFDRFVGDLKDKIYAKAGGRNV